MNNRYFLNYEKIKEKHRTQKEFAEKLGTTFRNTANWQFGVSRQIVIKYGLGGYLTDQSYIELVSKIENELKQLKECKK